MLVQCWIEALVYLQTTLGCYNDAPVALLIKTKWVSDKLLSLEQGVVVLMMQHGTFPVVLCVHRVCVGGVGCDTKLVIGSLIHFYIETS